MREVQDRVACSVLASTEAPSLNLREIERRANAATKGRWSYGRDWGENGAVANTGPLAEYVYTEAPDKLHRTPDELSRREQVANARFIAHARTDVPVLVAEVRKLRRLLKAKE